MDHLAHVFDVLMPETVHICVSYTVEALINDGLTCITDGSGATNAHLACQVHLSTKGTVSE